jgi:hypothetical protein
MIAVLKATKQHPSSEWIEMAKGETDQYGNPFEIIELRWTGGPNHLNTQDAKTRGFEDTILAPGPGGTIKISYRPGSVTWTRSMNGRGPYTGLLARTPMNMQKLASCYRDRLWRITSPAVDAEVKALSDLIWEGMNPEMKEFNEKRITAMHTGTFEGNLQAPSAVPAEVDARDLLDQKKALAKREQELKDREERLRQGEEKLLGHKVARISDGAAPVRYTREYLVGLGWTDLRSLSKTLAVRYPHGTKSAELVELILAKQEGVPEPVESVAS